MTQSSRALLAKFFKVHPGFLVDDPEGYHTELTSDLRTTEGQLDVWLLQGSERFASDPEVSDVLIKAAREKDTRALLAAAGRDSGYAGAGRPPARSVAAGTWWPAEQSPCTRLGKGGGSDDLVRFLFDLFRGRFLLQLLVVRVWRLALRPSASAALSRARRPHLPAAYVRWHTLPLRRTRTGCAWAHRRTRRLRIKRRRRSGVSPFNPLTLTAFLAWFGGTGYLLTRFSTLMGWPRTVALGGQRHTGGGHHLPVSEPRC